METHNKTKRGRKSNMSIPDSNQKISLKLHHFNYSDNFATQLATFAKAHLEDNSKVFKSEWHKWKDVNAILIQHEISKIKLDGYPGNVEDKMYFSARYYYRKKAIRAKPDLPKQEKPIRPRKKYELFDKNELSQMNAHILSQIYNAINDGGDNSIDNLTPSKSFANYCEQHSGFECERTKKTYKNLYWRISKKCRENSNIGV